MLSTPKYSAGPASTCTGSSSTPLEYGISYVGGVGFRDDPQLVPPRRLGLRPTERSVYFHRSRGQLRKHYQVGQENQLDTLGIMLNIILLWQTVYTQAALDHHAANGHHPDPADVARLSPLGHPTITSTAATRPPASHLEHGADINWIGYDGLTPLDAAQRAQDPELASWLEHRVATTNNSN